MKKLQMVLMVIMLSIPSLTFTFNPSYDITGTWHRTDGLDFHFFQDGKNVNMVSIVPGCNHLFYGYYIAPSVIEGMLVRKTSSGSITLMKLIFDISSANKMSEKGSLFDNNYPGDLSAGFSESFELSRTK